MGEGSGKETPESPPASKGKEVIRTENTRRIGDLSEARRRSITPGTGAPEKKGWRRSNATAGSCFRTRERPREKDRYPAKAGT